MQPTDQEHEHRQRVQLADLISRRSKDIVARWLEQVRADAAAAEVPLTELQDGIEDYLTRLAELLRGASSLDSVGTSAWSDVARAHAITRVRLGFDVTQLFHELEILRKVTMNVLREEGILRDEQADRVSHLIDAALASSLESYIDFRDYTARRSEAEHIGFLTHELKNPLGAVVMAVDQLTQQELTPVQRRLCEILVRNLGRMRHLIDDALLTERLQIGEVEAHQMDMTLGQLLGDSIELFERSAADKNITLMTTYDPNVIVRADPRLTLSATENLLENAIKYTDAGRVSFEVEDSPDATVFHIRDNCHGLSPEEMRVIFEPFKRAHTRKPGSGLGLAIARRAIETQGGTIHVESRSGEGCHFWFTLPRMHH